MAFSRNNTASEKSSCHLDEAKEKNYGKYEPHNGKPDPTKGSSRADLHRQGGKRGRFLRILQEDDHPVSDRERSGRCGCLDFRTRQSHSGCHCHFTHNSALVWRSWTRTTRRIC